MYQLSTTELYAGAAFASLFSACVFFWLYISRFASKGILWWSASMLSCTVALSSYFFTGILSNPYYALFGLPFAILGYICFWFGVRRAIGRKINRLIVGIAAASLLMAIVFGYYYSIVNPSETNHTLVFCLLSIPYTLIIAYDLYFFTPNRKNTKLLAVASLIDGVMLSLLAASCLVTPLSPHNFTRSWNGLFFMFWEIVIIFLTTICIIMILVEELSASLLKQAKQDPLTGLFNRHALHEITPDRFLELKEQAGTLGFLMLDIDHFKKVNDTYGHATGDELLKHFSMQVKRCLRSTDHFFRIGGEEFLVVAQTDTVENIRMLGERIREQVEESPLLHSSYGSIPHTVSIGYSSAKQHDETLQSSLNRADEALYNAKRNGRNKVEGQ